MVSHYCCTLKSFFSFIFASFKAETCALDVLHPQLREILESSDDEREEEISGVRDHEYVVSSF